MLGNPHNESVQHDRLRCARTQLARVFFAVGCSMVDQKSHNHLPFLPLAELSCFDTGLLKNENQERGGTGGALFRNLYRDYLKKCADRLEDPRIE